MTEEAIAPVNEDELWNAAAAELKKLVREDLYDNFFAGIKFVRVDDTTLYLSVPTGFLANFLLGYSGDIIDAWHAATGNFSAKEVRLSPRLIAKAPLEERPPKPRKMLVLKANKAELVPATAEVEESRAPSLAQKVESIAAEVAQHFQFRVEDILSESRSRPSNALALARHVAVYLARTLHPEYPFRMLGKVFGGRDYATMIHSVKRVSELRRTNQKFDEEVAELLALFAPLPAPR